MSNLKIALVSCVKNEEPVIGRLIQSVQGPNKFWDKFVITDTGSTDRTIEIARSMGVEVVQGSWPNHFGEARNMAAKNAGDDVDVIVNFDGDEVLGFNGQNLRRRIEEEWAKGLRMLGIRYNFSRDPNGNVTCSFTRQVIFDPKLFTWKGRVHEWLEGPQKPGLVGHIDDVHLDHYPKQGWAEEKAKRDLELLQMEAEENPKNGRVMFYLGREYMYHKEYYNAIESLEKCIEVTNWHLERAGAYNLLADCYLSTKQPEKLVDAYHECIKLAPNRREGYYGLAKFYYDNQKWQAAVAFGEAACAIPHSKEIEKFATNMNIYTWMPHDILSIAYWNLGQKQRGQWHLEQALAHRPNDSRLLQNRGWFM